MWGYCNGCKGKTAWIKEGENTVCANCGKVISHSGRFK